MVAALVEEVLAALRRAVEHHPFDEAPHCRVIAALSVTGRQAEAMEQFEVIRRGPADELGVEPGPKLRADRQHLLPGPARPLSRYPPGEALRRQLTAASEMCVRPEPDRER